MGKVEKTNVNEANARYKEKVKMEENALDEELKVKKNQLLVMKSEEKIGIERLREELIAAKRKLEAAVFKKEEEERKGKLFLKNVLEKTITYFEDCDQIEKERSSALVSCIRRKLEEVKTATKDIENKCIHRF